MQQRCEAEAFRFREPKTVVEEENLVDKAFPSSMKYKNKWVVTISNEWQTAQKIQDWLYSGGMFEDYVSSERYPPKTVYLIVCRIRRCLD